MPHGEETPPPTHRMPADLQPGNAKATRLAREGRLAEATALIQRALGGLRGGAPPPGMPHEGGKLDPDRPRGPRLLPASATHHRAPAIEPAPGRFVEESYAHKTGARSYRLYIPTGYRNQALPLVVMLHGCTQSPEDLAAGTRMNLHAEARTFFAAFPAQASRANSSHCWNWFRPGNQRRDMGEPALVAGITSQIQERYHIDPTRIYIAGMSAGGAMAVVLGALYPDLYAAVGVHSGIAYGAAHDLPSALAAMQGGAQEPAALSALARELARERDRVAPIVVFHGDADTTVSSVNADQIVEQWTAALGEAAKHHAARPDSLHIEIRRGQAPGGRGYTCRTSHGAHGQVLVEQWIIHGAGHAWSGGSPAGAFTEPGGPDASAAMVRFFLAHRLAASAR